MKASYYFPGLRLADRENVPLIPHSGRIPGGSGHPLLHVTRGSKRVAEIAWGWGMMLALWPGVLWEMLNELLIWRKGSHVMRVCPSVCLDYFP